MREEAHGDLSGSTRGDATKLPRSSLFLWAARQPARPISTATLTLIFGFEVLANALQRMPRDLAFTTFAFADPGSWIAVQYVTAHGARPGVDFGYPYGLLPIAIGRMWFGLFGLTPWAYETAMIACGLLIALAIARMAHVLRLSVIGITFLFFALPVGIHSSYSSLAHGVEAVLLAHAIAAQTSGNRPLALALAGAAWFARPAMGGVYGVMLMLAIVVSVARTIPMLGWRVRGWAVLRALLPAVATTIVIFGSLIVLYGRQAVIATLLPLAGIRAYHLMHFGFFGSHGRTFWYAPGTSAIVYAATITPFWLAGSAWLIVAAFVALRRLAEDAQNQETALRYEVVACCGAMIAMFVFVMFGGPTSWSTYSYVLVMGVAASGLFGLVPARIVAALTLAAIVGQIGFIVNARGLMETTSPNAVTAGLWCNTEERAEWAQVKDLTHGSRAMIVAIGGGAALLDSGFAPPFSPYLVPGLAYKHEFDRTARDVISAPMVVLPISPEVGGYALTSWPDLTRALAGLDVVWRGRLYVVYRHRADTHPK
jgi:hypothetical protein